MKAITFTVQVQADFNESKVGKKTAATLLCQEINQILAKYNGSTGGAHVIPEPKYIEITDSDEDGMKRRCKRCRKPERIRSIGGVRYSNFAPHLGLCAKCINAIMK